MGLHLNQGDDELVENHEINVTPFIDVMLVLLVAKIVGDATGVQPIYDLHITMKGVPFLEAEADTGAAVQAGDLVKAQSVVTLGAVETVETISSAT